MSGLVVITAGAGYLGQWCAIEAIRRGLRVRAVARSVDEVPRILGAVAAHVAIEGVLETVVVVEVTGHEAWVPVLAGARFVVHPGPEAAPPESVTGLNQNIVRRLLDASHAAGVERVVLTSSVRAALPADGAGTASEEVWTDPTTAPDAGLDAVVERTAVEHADRLGTELVTLLPGIMLGPPADGRPLPELGLVADLVTGRVSDVPKRSVEIVDVRDVATANINALLSPAASGRYLIPGEPYWLLEVARVLRHRLGNRGKDVPTTELVGWRKALLGWLAPTGGSVVVGTPQRLVHSSERARRDLDWDPGRIDDTIIETAEIVLRGRRPQPVWTVKNRS